MGRAYHAQANTAPPPHSSSSCDRRCAFSLRVVAALFRAQVISLSRSQQTSLLGEAHSHALRELVVPRPGHCGATEQGEEGDCHAGERGSLPYGPTAPAAFGVHLRDEVACVNFCRERCPRCRCVACTVGAAVTLGTPTLHVVVPWSGSMGVYAHLLAHRYVSISAKGQDCSWYHACNWESLEHEPRWLRHKTYQVRAA
jgi:hypothetical protein